MHTTPTSPTHGIGWTSTVLVIIGALSSGLSGFFDYDLVGAVFGAGSPAASFFNGLVGLAGLYMIYFAIRLSIETRRPVPEHATSET